MKRFNVLHPLILSFFSRDLYRDVARNWKGLGFGYLLLLLALAWVPPMLQLHRTLGALTATVAPAILEQIPTVTIRNGQVSMDEPQPYTVRAPGTGAALIVIDTTGRIVSLDDTEGLALLTRDRFYVRKNVREVRSYELAGVRDLTIGRAQADRIVRFASAWLAPVAYPFALAGSYAYRILQALLYAAIGMGLAKLVGADLPYPALVRLAAVAVTPVIVLDTLRGVAGWHFPFGGVIWWAICFAFAMGYLLYAIQANADPAGKARTVAISPS